MKQTDPRTLFTQQMLKDACISLVEEKALSKITINELCEKAGVNRSTFYRYYQDIYALWESIEDDCFQDLINRISLPDAGQTNVFFDAIFAAIKENSILTPNVLAHIDSARLVPAIISHYKKIAISHWKQNEPSLSDRQLDYMFSTLIGALTSLVNQWIQNGMTDSFETMGEMVKELGFWGLFQ